MSEASAIVFLCTAVVALASAGGTVFSATPLRAALFLLLHTASLAVLFVTLSAELLAAIQLILYAGAVVVLFVFVIMVIGPARDTRGPPARAVYARIVSGFVIALIAVSLTAALSGYRPDWVALPPSAALGTVEGLGTPLFTEALVPFELVGVLLTVAAIGAVAVARGRSKIEVERLARQTQAMEAGDGTQATNEKPIAGELPAHGGR